MACTVGYDSNSLCIDAIIKSVHFRRPLDGRWMGLLKETLKNHHISLSSSLQSKAVSTSPPAPVAPVAPTSNGDVNSPVNSATALKNRPLSIMASKGKVLQRAKVSDTLTVSLSPSKHTYIKVKFKSGSCSSCQDLISDTDQWTTHHPLHDVNMIHRLVMFGALS